MTYAEKLKDPRWQKKRLEIMSRDEFKCRSCGDSSRTLNVHHCYYNKGAMPWDYPDSALVTYCERCHKIIEWRISHMNREIHGGGSRQHKFLRLLNADLCDGPFAPPCFAHLIDRIDSFLHNYEDAISDDDGSDEQIRKIKELKRRAHDLGRVFNDIVEFTEESCTELSQSPPLDQEKNLEMKTTKPKRKRKVAK